MERTGCTKETHPDARQVAHGLHPQHPFGACSLLLKRGNMSIGEIADAVDFRQDYMSKCFQEKFYKTL